MRPAAVADHRNALPSPIDQGIGAGLEPAQCPFGAVGVGEEADAAGAVADRAQPDCHRGQCVVAGQESRHQQNRAAVAAWNPSAAEHRMGEQARRVELPAELAEGVPPPAALGRPVAICTRGRHGPDPIAAPVNALVLATQAPTRSFWARRPTTPLTAGGTLPALTEQRKATGPTQEDIMHPSEKQAKVRDRLSLSALMVTIVIANVLTLVY